MTIGLGHYLSVAAILFTLGIFGIFLNRKNVIVILMSIELILLAVNINLVAFSTHLGDIVGQIFALLVLTVAAAEAAIGLAILVVFYRNRGSIAVEDINTDEGLGAHDPEKWEPVFGQDHAQKEDGRYGRRSFRLDEGLSGNVSGDRLPAAARRHPGRHHRACRRARPFPGRGPVAGRGRRRHRSRYASSCRAGAPRRGRSRRPSRPHGAGRRRLAHDRADHHHLPDDLDDPVVDRLCAGRLRPPRRAGADLPLDHLRRPQYRLGAAHRHAHRGDAGGGDDRVGARASLFHRLHARGPVPAALLRLSVDVHLRHADAGDVGQPGAAVLRLGRGGAGELPLDRLLVSEAVGQRRRHQGLRGQPRRRLRLRARHLRRVHADQVGRLRHRVRRRRRRSPARPFRSSAGTPMR